MEKDLIVSEYHQNKFVLLPSFVSRNEADLMTNSMSDHEVREVICGIPDVSWGEQQIDRNDYIYDFFVSTWLLLLVSDCAGYTRDQLKRVMCWTSVYQQGEYINPHRDSEGEIQIILCLTNADLDNGGFLIVELKDREQEVHLHSGDGVIFKASEITHYTTPLMPTENISNPKRVVAVARYYFSD